MAHENEIRKVFLPIRDSRSVRQLRSIFNDDVMEPARVERKARVKEGVKMLLNFWTPCM